MNVPAFENTMDGALQFWVAVDARRNAFFGAQKEMSVSEANTFLELMARGVQGPLFRGSSCWLWQGTICTYGYGLLPDAVMGTRRVHRALYQLVFGAMSLKYDLDHLCRVRHCFNVCHAEPVSHRENLLRGISVSAINAASVACPKGHPYSGVNIRGDRFCHTCYAEAARRSRLRRKTRAGRAE